MVAGVEPEFVLAIPDNFDQQCTKTDVIYFHGGDDYLLQYWMRKFDLSKIFEDKIVATNSGSSDMLSKYYWTCDWRECQEGFGVLPIKFIPHYDSSFGSDDPRGPVDWNKAMEELKDFGEPDLPIYALHEGDYIVFEDTNLVSPPNITE